MLLYQASGSNLFEKRSIKNFWLCVKEFQNCICHEKIKSKNKIGRHSREYFSGSLRKI
jgi:hypothetical protein